MNEIERASRIWTGNWYQRVAARIRSLGYKDATAFALAFPCEPYVDLVRRLGTDIPAVQFECVQFDEAERCKTIRDAAMDSLIRDLHWHLKSGWEGGTRGYFATSSASVDWLLRLEGTSRNAPINSALRMRGEAVWKALEALQPPIGWVPAGVDDHYITSAFNEAWPR
jgi:hypothetical protein